MTAQKRDVLAWVLLIGLVFFSVVRTQAINNDLADTQEQVALSQECTQSYLAATVMALNQRTDLSSELNQADEERIRSQGRLIGFLVVASQNPEKADPKRYQEVLDDYFSKLTEYLSLLRQQERIQRVSQYPTTESYIKCLKGQEQ